MWQLPGLEPEERAVVFHVDDVGMCEATVSAFEDLLDDGWVRSGSLMVTCPWFPAAAELAARCPAADFGAHLTLTSEWTAYRWGPLSTRDPRSSLVDEAGYFPRERSAAVAADPDEVRAELMAQIRRLKDAGIEPSHVDSHMLVLGDRRLLPGYVEVAADFGLFPVLWSPPDSPTEPFRPTVIEPWASSAAPTLQDLVVLPRDRAFETRERVDLVVELCRSLPPGLSQLTFHPARDTPELRRLAPDWLGRVADLEVLLDPSLPQQIADLGIRVVDYGQMVSHDLRKQVDDRC